MPYIKGGTTQSKSSRPEVADVYHSPTVFANSVPVALWLPPIPSAPLTFPAPGEVIDGVYIPDNPYQFFFAQPLLCEAGNSAPHDDPDSPVVNYPPCGEEPPTVGSPTSITGDPQVSTGTDVECGNYIIDPIDYNQQLSSNYTIRSLTIGTVFPHQIVAQNGLTVADIICNLKALAENIVQPLARQYPGFNINSGFRKGTSTSQHNRGQAVDIQWPGLPAAEYTERAQWIKANLPFDQLIFEHGNSIWLHISYNRTLSTQRNALLTFYPKVSPQYKPGLTNYYA
jgi:hypothetical protein